MIDAHGLATLWARMKEYVQAYVIEGTYSLPIATTDVLGGVKPDGTTITIDENGVISGASTYELPIATDSTLGGVMVDGETITVDENGTISGSSTYELPMATDSALGGVIVDGETIVAEDGVISATYQLPMATYESIGGVMPDGETIGMTANGEMVVIGVPANAISGTISPSVLPSFVDDVVEAYPVGQELSQTWLSNTSGGDPIAPEQGKIYVIMDGPHENESYRWSGTTYVSIGNPLDIATEAEARAGTDNTKAMTPLRVAQAVAVLSPTPTYDSQISTSSTNAVQNATIKAALDLKADLNSPVLTGSPTAPTPTSGTSNRQIATTEFVMLATSGFLTSESDPTVPSWAKQPAKPTYTASEVGALPDTTHIPTTVAELSDESTYATKAYADGAYTLPVASQSTLGGVRVDGTTIGINADGEIYVAIASGDEVGY